MYKLYSIDEIASRLGIKKSTLYTWVHYKKIPYIKIGRKLAFSEEKIIEFINENTYEQQR